MSNTYAFGLNNDPAAKALCDDIVNEMMRLCGIPAAEALGRVNDYWRGVDFEHEDYRFHETPDYWAQYIYYDDVHFWIEGEKLIVRPYPSGRGDDQSNGDQS
jgi:hypothetical protein